MLEEKSSQSIIGTSGSRNRAPLEYNGENYERVDLMLELVPPVAFGIVSDLRFWPVSFKFCKVT